ncbi:nuclease-related domain-containing protein [Flavobacterium sp. 3HN19-14]|uniref:nuclease-related domain-containing protein n=1 Tax=Flavobacterium sp. 3HN19-14 TaxID=3448133 RepID=UPI003EE03C49
MLRTFRLDLIINMCRIFNTIGSLSDIQLKLVNNGIDDFTSLQQLLAFESQSVLTEQELISEHSKIISNEENELRNQIFEIQENYRLKKANFISSENQKLEILYNQISYLTEPESALVPIVKDYLKHFIIWCKIWKIQLKLFAKQPRINFTDEKAVVEKQKRLDYINQYYDMAVNQSCYSTLHRIQKKREIINSVRNSVFGAQGEYEVEKMLKELSNDYVLINNFCYSFNSSLYYRNENQYISSIQIDHILIAPNGIYVIETKHWSKESINNEQLRSPIDQIKRLNFALYVILSNAVSKANIQIDTHRWGTKKLPLRNIVVFTRSVPNAEFEFVKILGLNQLLSYIRYFNPLFTQSEIESISSYLLSISESKNIISKLNI